MLECVCVLYVRFSPVSATILIGLAHKSLGVLKLKNVLHEDEVAMCWL